MKVDKRFYEGIADAELRGYVERVYSELRHCLLCQPYENGEAVWVLGREIYIRDLFDDLEIPQDRWEDVAAELHCPGCGAELDIDSDVGTRSYEEVWIDNTWDAWEKKYSRRLNEFYAHLERFPYLGQAHELGSEIFKAVTKFPTCEIKDEEWYRSRNISSSKSMDSDDMYPPDPNKVVVPEGRFNHHGQSMFYLANSEEGAAAERLEDESGILWIQKFRIAQAANIVDFSVNFELGLNTDVEVLAFGLIYGENLSIPVKREKGWKPEYFIPRFIADCARLRGFNGIRYRSSRSHLSNLVLFSWDKESIVPVTTPSVLTFRRTPGRPLVKEIDSDDIPF